MIWLVVMDVDAQMFTGKYLALPGDYCMFINANLLRNRL
jgi:hypothetical protein